MPNLVKDKQNVQSKFKEIIDSLPYNTQDIKKALSDVRIIDRSTIDKWYKGTHPLRDISKIVLVMNFLNENFPKNFGEPLKLEDFNE